VVIVMNSHLNIAMQYEPGPKSLDVVACLRAWHRDGNDVLTSD
jgi:hypothetical protein